MDIKGKSAADMLHPFFALPARESAPAPPPESSAGKLTLSLVLDFSKIRV